MAYIFYGFALLALMHDAMIISGINELHDKLNNLVTKKAEDRTSTEKIYGDLHLLYFLWVFVGLFSSQWFGFAAMLILSLILIPIKKIKAGRVIDSCIGIAILLFIIINKYHFHYRV